MKTKLQIISEKCNGSLYYIDLINQDKTTSVNGHDMPWYYLALVSAQSAVGLMALGMKVRNLNVTKIRESLSQYGIYINQRTAYDVYISVCCILGDLGKPIPTHKIPTFVKPNDRLLLQRYNEQIILCDCGQPCCE